MAATVASRVESVEMTSTRSASTQFAHDERRRQVLPRNREKLYFAPRVIISGDDERLINSFTLRSWHAAALEAQSATWGELAAESHASSRRFISIAMRTSAVALLRAMKAFISIFVIAAACGPSSGGSGGDAGGHGDGKSSGDANRPVDGARGTDGSSSAQRTIFVIPMENESASAIYGDTTNAPYINNTLMAISAHATNFTDELPSSIPSEPHYVWMEAGTNVFSDNTFTNDADPSASNSTSSTAHLTAQLRSASIAWTTYQEGISAGSCPISTNSGTFYAAKHDPFVFFQDISGNPPSSSNAYCAAHHKPYSAFAGDLAAGTMPPFVFITPNLCHDMHGASGCPSGTGTSANIAAGDTWLSNELPRILAYANAHDSVVYLIWDEGSSNQTIPFLLLGPHVKTGASATAYTHSSQLKSIEEQLGVPVLSKVAGANDFAGMFQAGYFP
jgi:phosphatidylinositol-3-phosphatase